MKHRLFVALATGALMAGPLVANRGAAATSSFVPGAYRASHQRLQSVAHPLGTAVRAAATIPDTATLSDPKGDVSSCQGDIVSTTITFQQASTVEMSVVLACSSNPNTDPSWTASTAVTMLAFAVDVNGDGDEEYDVAFAPELSGNASQVEVFHTANGDFTHVCTASAAWDGSSDISVSVPSSCLGSPVQVQAYAGLLWDENPTGETCVCDIDLAPDSGWVGPVGPASAAPPPSPPATPQGYWLVASDGGIFSFGNAGFFGSTGNIHLNKPIVGMASAKGGQGYWFVASDGGIFSFGNTQFFGSTGAIHLNQPIVGMAATPDGGGYWLVASDGGIFAFGDAKFFGSTGAIHLNRPIVGMATTDDGLGYWLVASDGGIFGFGDAKFFGSTGSLKLNQPIVGMALAGAGRGYWLASSDGATFAFGPDAAPYGSGAGKPPTPVVGISATPDRLGFRLVTNDGRVEAFGDATNLGDMTGKPLAHPVVGMATPA
jgi:hypothetical protein